MADENMLEKEGDELPRKTNSQDMMDSNEDEPIEYDEEDEENELTDEELEMLTSKLDQLNSVLDFLEEKNDSIHAQLVELLQSNKETREELKVLQEEKQQTEGAK